MSLRNQILAAEDLYSETVTVPEWGVDVLVKSPTVAVRNEVLAAVTLEDGSVDNSALFQALVVICACDPETGELMFTKDDIPALSGKSAKAMERVALAAFRVSGMDPDGVEVGKGDS